MKKLPLLFVLILSIFVLTACGSKTKIIPVTVNYQTTSDINEFAGRDVPLPYEDFIFDGTIKHEDGETIFSTFELNASKNPNYVMPLGTDEFLTINPELFEVDWIIYETIEYKESNQECLVFTGTLYSEYSNNKFDYLTIFNSQFGGHLKDRGHRCFDNIESITYTVRGSLANCGAAGDSFKCNTEQLQLTKYGNTITFTVYDQVTQEDLWMISDALIYKGINTNILPLKIMPDTLYTIDITKP